MGVAVPRLDSSPPGGTPPLIWALTGWRIKPDLPAERYHDVVAALVAAGAAVTQNLLDWDKARADPHMLAALSGKPNV